MFGRSKRQAAFETARPYAERLARDERLRDRLAAALAYATVAARRTQRYRGVSGFARRVATDQELREQVRLMARELGKARSRLERRRKKRSRAMLLALVAGGGVAVVAVPQSREWLKRRLGGGWSAEGWQAESGFKTIQADIEVEAPVSTAYNQWTQFEEFPLFMEGVDDVKQIDETTLHWVATVGGKRAEWDAKILEQVPDRRIAWESIDGKQTRGTVTFQPIDTSRPESASR